MKLAINWNEAEGRVEFCQRFLNQDALFRLDILKDWISDLENEYLKTHKECFKELDNAQPFEPESEGA